MYKKIISIMTGILFFPQLSIALAAENPFADIPPDHWSRTVINSLAQKGIVTGYDGQRFLGMQPCTRYEMAQIVAKAMSRENVDKETGEMLAALETEYARELQSLGIRVQILEEKNDQVQLHGLVRLDMRKDKIKKNGMVYKDLTKTQARLRLEPSAKINENWILQTRIDYDSDLKADGDAVSTMKMAYVQGQILNGYLAAGRIDLVDFPGMNAPYGLVFDTYMSGVKFSFGEKIRWRLAAGRISQDDTAYGYAGLTNYPNSTMDYQGIQIESPVSEKCSIGAAVHLLRDADLSENQKIYEVSADYRISPTLRLGGAYAKTNLRAENFALSKAAEENAYTIQLDYKGVNRKVPDSFGIWMAYRQLGNLAVAAPTYVAQFNGEKGIEWGGKYMFDKNFMGQCVYFHGEKISSERSVNRIFGRLEYRF